MSPVDVDLDRSPVEKIPIRSTYFFYVIMGDCVSGVSVYIEIIIFFC